jgi:hypothetical protein
LYQAVKLVYDTAFESQAQANATISAPSFELPAGALDNMPFPSSDEPAPPDVFQEEEQEIGSLVEQVEALVRNEQESNIITGDQAPIEFVSPYNDPHFDQKAFPDLYPCGSRGGPNNIHDKVFLLDSTYVKLRMNQGLHRSFQRHSAWMFYHYFELMKKRIGGISYVAAKNCGGRVPCATSNAASSSSASVSSNAEDMAAPTVDMTKRLIAALKDMKAAKGTRLDISKLPTVRYSCCFYTT